MRRIEKVVTEIRSPLKAKILSSEYLLSQEVLHHVQEMFWGELQSGAVVNQAKDVRPVAGERHHHCNRRPASMRACALLPEFHKTVYSGMDPTFQGASIDSPSSGTAYQCPCSLQHTGPRTGGIGFSAGKLLAKRQAGPWGGWLEWWRGSG